MVNCKCIFEEEFLEIAYKNKPSGLSRLASRIRVANLAFPTTKHLSEMM
jgi:hypothetical protein